MHAREITGLVLAGGRGSRMGGVDKGLQAHHGVPLAPQVASVMINANRHGADYAAFGAPVWPDTVPDFAGPLAGFLAGLAHCKTPYLMTVPCDAPQFPQDLVARLGAAMAQAQADIAIPRTEQDGAVQLQPVFCLMKTSLADDLLRFVDRGARKVEHWITGQVCVQVPFADASAFRNANTLDELRQLQTR
jgi:molybdopterin-guanine dinucleotide biosynthesis protein A